MKKIAILTMVLFSGLLIGCGSNEDPKDVSVAKEGTEETTEETIEETTESTESDSSNNPKVAIDIENYGVITVELDEKAAPITVANFLKLINEGFYDGLTFHRVIDGFMMQGGDPTGTGMGGADENIKGEFSNNGVDNTLSHTKGAIAMARSTELDSASSQFFIVDEDSTFLDGDYAAFGYVIDGQDIVDAVCAETTVIDGNGTVESENQPIIKSIKVVN